MSLRKISTVDDLRAYLQAALQLEHSTIPPYLTALYSMLPSTNADAAEVLRMVAIEEMLHLTLAANLLNAVGGSPDLTGPDFVPSYPACLPDGEQDFSVSIAPFSRETVETFLKIERPSSTPADSSALVARTSSAHAVLATVTSEDGTELHFYSIGEFYREIARGFSALEQQLVGSGKTLFVGAQSKQVTPDYYYSGGGQIVRVVDLASALEAIRLITDQGEGFGGGIYDHDGELAHYYRLQQLVLGRNYQKGDQPGAPTGAALTVDWTSAQPMKPDASLTDYPEGSTLRASATQFCAAYQAFLKTLTRAFNGEPELLGSAVGDMFRIKELACQIIGTAIPGTSAHAAPIYRQSAS